MKVVRLDDHDAITHNCPRMCDNFMAPDDVISHYAWWCPSVRMSQLKNDWADFH